MKSNSFWFRHDANATGDIKMLKLMSKHGLGGIGAFWLIIEHLFQNEGYSDADAMQMFCKRNAIAWEIVKFSIELMLLHKKDQRIFSDRLLEELINKEEKSKKMRANALKKWRGDAKSNKAAIADADAYAFAMRGEERRGEENTNAKIENSLAILKSKLLQSIGIEDFYEDDREQIKLLRKFEKLISSGDPEVVNAAFSKMNSYYGYQNFRKLDSLYKHFRTLIPK